MPNINKNIIKQAGAAVANATNKAAALFASTPEPGTIISAIQLVNGGREIGPVDVAHFTESVRNKLLSLLVPMDPIQSGSGNPSPDNVRPISGRTGLTIYVSPTPNAADATTYAVDWTDDAGTVYGGTLDVVSGELVAKMGTITANDFTSYVNGSSSGGLHWVEATVGVTANAEAISSMLEWKATRAGWESTTECFSTENGKIRVYTSETSLADFKTKSANLTVCYELATPLTYQLTGTDIVTLVGDNYIWSDSGDVTITE